MTRFDTCDLKVMLVPKFVASGYCSLEKGSLQYLVSNFFLNWSVCFQNVNLYSEFSYMEIRLTSQEDRASLRTMFMSLKCLAVTCSVWVLVTAYTDAWTPSDACVLSSQNYTRCVMIPPGCDVSAALLRRWARPLLPARLLLVLRNWHCYLEQLGAVVQSVCASDRGR